MKKNLTREEFSRHFKEVNASLRFEGAELNEKEEELLYKKITGKITDEEYNKAIMEAGKK